MIAGKYRSTCLSETNSAMNAQKLAKWKRWLGDANTRGTIIHEIVELDMIRQIFAGVREVVSNNPALHRQSAFYYVFMANYAHSVLMYVRRQVNPDRDSIGLIMLACDLRDNCTSITQDYYASLYTREADDEQARRDREAWGRSDFLMSFGGTTKNHLDPAIIKVDIDELQAIRDASESFIDRRLAHLDGREPKHIPTLPEIESWCDTLNAKLRKYILLLEGTDFQIRVVLQHDWRAIFRSTWLPNSSSG